MMLDQQRMEGQLMLVTVKAPLNTPSQTPKPFSNTRAPQKLKPHTPHASLAGGALARGALATGGGGAEGARAAEAAEAAEDWNPWSVDRAGLSYFLGLLQGLRGSVQGFRADWGFCG